jgi:membrane-associated phospholipid phosphatase
MQKIVAKLLTGIFNPLLMPTYGILILFHSNTYYAILPYEAKKVIFLTVIISTCLLPLSFLPLFIYQNFIKSIAMKTRQERLVPFSVIFIMYLLAYFLLNRMGVPDMINNVILAGAITILLLTIITLKWKVSAHMAGVGALTGALFIFSSQLQADFITFIILAILIAGLTGVARIILKAHTPGEIYVGFGIGLLTLFSTFMIF